jgi:hypothetical protein
LTSSLLPIEKKSENAQLKGVFGTPTCCAKRFLSLRRAHNHVALKAGSRQPLAYSISISLSTKGDQTPGFCRILPLRIGQYPQLGSIHKIRWRSVCVQAYDSELSRSKNRQAIPTIKNRINNNRDPQ